MIAATAASTSAALSRLASSSLRKAGSNPASRVVSLAGIRLLRGYRRPSASTDRVAKTLDPTADLFRSGLQRRPVDDQPRADLGERLDLDQTIGLQRRPGLDEIDDVMAEAEMRGELDRAVQLDAFRLNAARGKVAAGHLWVFCSHPDVTRVPNIFPRNPVCGGRHRDMATPDIEIERRVNFRVVEFHQHVVAGDAELGGAEGDKGGDVEAPHPNQIESGLTGRKTQLA